MYSPFDLELRNDTPDIVINRLPVTEQRIVSDFFDSFVIKREPHKLILVKLGNTSKKDLIDIFRNRFDEIIEQISVEDMVLLRR